MNVSVMLWPEGSFNGQNWLQLVPCLNTWFFLSITIELISGPSLQPQRCQMVTRTCTKYIKCQVTCATISTCTQFVFSQTDQGCPRTQGCADRQPHSTGWEPPSSPGCLKSGRSPCAQGIVQCEANHAMKHCLFFHSWARFRLLSTQTFKTSDQMLQAYKSTTHSQLCHINLRLFFIIKLWFVCGVSFFHQLDIPVRASHLFVGIT